MIDEKFEDGFMKTAGIIAKGLKKAKRAVQSLSNNPNVHPSTRKKIVAYTRKNNAMARAEAKAKLGK